jgi:hypothetical protein
MARRSLTSYEYNIANGVFQGTVPYRFVIVTDKIGLHDLPYTVSYMGLEDHDTYHLNVGKDGFEGMGSSLYWRGILVHELTHVWQAAHSAWPPSYIFNSVWHHVMSDDAYAYTPGKGWSEYNVEQQGQIVQDWFTSGQRESSELFPYIRDFIRTGRTR